MTAHPIAAARILGAAVFLLFVGNFCKALQKIAVARKWALSYRQKVALDMGVALGNVIWGFFALARAFVRGEDPDHTDNPPNSA